MTKNHAGDAPVSGSNAEGKRPPAPKMGVEEGAFARMNINADGAGVKSNGKGIPAPNALPVPLPNGDRGGGAKGGRNNRRGGKGGGGGGGDKNATSASAPGGGGSGDGDDAAKESAGRAPRAPRPKREQKPREPRGGDDATGDARPKPRMPSPKPAANAKAGGGAAPAPNAPPTPVGAYTPPGARERDAAAARTPPPVPVEDKRPAKGLIPLPKGHPALGGESAGDGEKAAAGSPAPAPAPEKGRRAAKKDKPLAESTNGAAVGDDAPEKSESRPPEEKRKLSKKEKRIEAHASGETLKKEKEAAKPKERKPKPSDDGAASIPRALAAQVGKEIRRLVEGGDMEGALDVFHENAKKNAIDVDTARALLHGLVRAVRLHEACDVADHLKNRGIKIPLKHFTTVVLALSQRANPMDALDLLNALEPCINYESKAIHCYHFHFLKLIVQEFLEEALQTLDRVANAPAFGLQENGLAAMDVVIRTSQRGGQLSLQVPALAEELNRGLMKGDTVLLSRTGEAARQTGLGEMPTGPRGGSDVDLQNLEMPTGPRTDGAERGRGDRRGGGGGWRADYEFEAEVSTMYPNLSVKLIGCTPAQASSVRGGGWRVDKLANRTSFIRQLNALQNMVEVKAGTSQKDGVDPAIRDILVAGWDGNKSESNRVREMCAAEKNQGMHAIQRQKILDQAMDVQAMSHMNKSQTDALEAALFQRVTLIQGPPGTGKTHTAVALVQMWLRSGIGPVLCTSDSNIAVDNLVDGLSRAGVRVARIGRPEAVRQDLMQYMVESIAGIEPGCTWSKDQQYQAINGVLRRADVICATCAGAGSDILERFSFQACLIDEATQATEPATVVPLTKGCSQVVLIGDQKQLPPTIISREADAAGLGKSLFERMLSRGIKTFMLKVQYRMHPAIATFPSKAFYKNELLSGTPPSARRAPMGFDWPVPAVPMAFVDVPEGYERSDGSSQTNPVEAQKIVNIVKKLCQGHDVLPADIGIVSPYSAQVRAIERLLNGNQLKRRSRFDAPPPPDSLQALEVCSVDGFQGREKEVIVFTCTRANMNGNVGFLADPRRVNVMLTRARRGLIIVGHMPTLRREPTVWGPWLAWAGENGLICGAAATDAEAANRLATMGMSSLDEIGGRGAGETFQMGALMSPSMAGWGGGGDGGGEPIDEGPKLKERAFIPDAWDDSGSEDGSDDETETDVTTETESATVKGSTNSLAGMADQAWHSDDDDA